MLMHNLLIVYLFYCIIGGSVKDLVVKFDPDPPKSGAALTITITGQLGKLLV